MEGRTGNSGMIGIVDYGMGNLRSVQKAFQKVGFDAVVTSDPSVLHKADKVVLPGVGAFRDTMDGLNKLGLIEVIRQCIGEGKPYLGICLGMQILFSESEEGGLHKGLGLFEGRVVRFPKSELKVPHMGWNMIVHKRTTMRQSGSMEDACPLMNGIRDGVYVYFVHSYHVVPEDKKAIVTTTDYGISFASTIWKDNIYATQYHPEKSQEIGLKILENFGKIAA
jgi:glutamine amidotransferase